MFKKCLKYDIKAFSKIWLIAAAVMLVVAVLCGIGIGSLVNAAVSMDALSAQEEPSTLDTALTIARMFIGMICYMVLIYSLVIFIGGSSIMVYIRYYIKFFTDQGYLTFTLPVRRSTQFWSKAVSGLIYSTASGIVAFISVLFALAGVIVSLLLTPEIAEGLSLDELTAVLTPANVIYGILAFLLAIILIAAINFASMMMNYLIITLAATMFRKLKILSVIVSYYVVNNVIAVPIIYVGSYGLMFALMFLAMGLQALFALPFLAWLCIYALLLLGSLGAVTVGLIFANFAVQRLERKLNLA